MSVIWSGITAEGAVVPVQVTDEGKVVAVGDGPEGEFLKLTGGELTGILTSTSTAIFAGTVSTGANIAAAGNASIEGNVSAGYGASTGCLLSASGNAVFSSDVNIGGSITGAGSAEFAGNVNCATVECTQEFTYNRTFNGRFKEPDGSFTNKAQIFGDGSASFSGQVTAAGGWGSDLYALRLGGGGGLSVINPDTSAKAFVAYTGGYEASNIAASIGQDGSATFANGKCGFTTEGELIFTSRGSKYKLVVSDGFLFPEPF
jgi:cytoskeletal protein CcmA (bactofilin family)